MLTCKNCRQAVAPSAFQCPYCGVTFPVGMLRTALGPGIVAFVLLALLAFAINH